MQDQHNQLTVVTRELIALKRGLTSTWTTFLPCLSEQDVDYRTEIGWCKRGASGGLTQATKVRAKIWQWPGNEAKGLPQLCTFTGPFHFPIRV